MAFVKATGVKSGVLESPTGGFMGIPMIVDDRSFSFSLEHGNRDAYMKIPDVIDEDTLSF